MAISLAFAVSQFLWGASQPFTAALADRHGAGRVLAGGMLMVALGTALVPAATSTAMLIFAIGILLGVGAGAGGRRSCSRPSPG